MIVNNTVNETNMISIGMMEVGDIILSTSEGFVSSSIRLTTSSRFSHARLYIGDYKIIEAVEPAVSVKSLKEAMEHDRYTYVYRKPNLSAVQKAKIVEYSLEQDGKEYDLSGAVGSSGSLLPMASNLIAPEKDFYCSELVAFAYKFAGTKLTFSASQTTPRDLAENNNLVYVGRLK